MQVRLLTACKVLPVVGLLGLSGCAGITTLQFRDFLFSTAIQVVVQSLIELIRASVTGA